MAKARRSYGELFIDKLSDLSKGKPELVGNFALSKALGWSEEKYTRIKKQLLDEGTIIAGRGRGGSVALAGDPDESLNVFISYSHADEKLKNELVKHLHPLKRMGLIDDWHDRKLEAGDNWDQTISVHLESADIILVLVSIDFINSKYAYDIELDRALELQAEDNTRVIPVILRSCMWQHTPFAKLQALPVDAKPVATWPDQDEALAQVAEGIRKVAVDLLESR